ncbi:hypothetical protein GX51_04678 [Blastomyces parvus]|uniref:Uncharacterized protein n=1 Tax=Blastomyces parvus TaxID=2060905 RepID=A0A2B7X0L3_9EURO|nr:hypothetical protein GX51_04678 [Blastomyces parvus]
MPPNKGASAPPNPNAPAASNKPFTVPAKRQRQKTTQQAPDAHAGNVQLASVRVNVLNQRIINISVPRAHVGKERQALDAGNFPGETDFTTKA